jgi:RNA polymerase-binding transcription factor DksA
VDKDKLESYRSRLIKEKERLQGELKVIHDENAEAAGSRAAGVGGDQNFEDHMGDAATDLFDRERDLSLEQNVIDLIGQVDNALERIESGTYGLCEVCRRPIDEARLKAIPYASLCLEDKQREEGPR